MKKNLLADRDAIAEILGRAVVTVLQGKSVHQYVAYLQPYGL